MVSAVSDSFDTVSALRSLSLRRGAEDAKSDCLYARCAKNNAIEPLFSPIVRTVTRKSRILRIVRQLDVFVVSLLSALGT